MHLTHIINALFVPFLAAWVTFRETVFRAFSSRATEGILALVTRERNARETGHVQGQTWLDELVLQLAARVYAELGEKTNEGLALYEAQLEVCPQLSPG